MSDDWQIRINDLARELEVKSKAILDELPNIGIVEAKTHSSFITIHEAGLIRDHFKKQARPAPIQGARVGIDLSKISKPGDVMRLLRERERRQEAERQEALRGALSTSSDFRPVEQAPRSQVSIIPPVVKMLELPRKFTFHRGFVDFDYILDYFD